MEEPALDESESVEQSATKEPEPAPEPVKEVKKRKKSETKESESSSETTKEVKKRKEKKVTPSKVKSTEDSAAEEQSKTAVDEIVHEEVVKETKEKTPVSYEFYSNDYLKSITGTRTNH